MWQSDFTRAGKTLWWSDSTKVSILSRYTETINFFQDKENEKDLYN